MLGATLRPRAAVVEVSVALESAAMVVHALREVEGRDDKEQDRAYSAQEVWVPVDWASL